MLDGISNILAFWRSAQSTGFCFVYFYVLMGPTCYRCSGEPQERKELGGLLLLLKACNTAKLIPLRGLSLEERSRVELTPKIPNFKILQSYSN